MAVTLSSPDPRAHVVGGKPIRKGLGLNLVMNAALTEIDTLNGELGLTKQVGDQGIGGSGLLELLRSSDLSVLVSSPIPRVNASRTRV